MSDIIGGSGSDAEMTDQHNHMCNNKRSRHDMQLQTAFSGFPGRTFRISPTTVVESAAAATDDDAEKFCGSEDANNKSKRRKAPEDSPLIISMSSSEVISTIIHRFRVDATTSITKVTVGTYGHGQGRGRGGDNGDHHPATAFFGSDTAAYVAVHFSSNDGKRWGELRTTDGTGALHLIGDAALPSIQAYLRQAR